MKTFVETTESFTWDKIQLARYWTNQTLHLQRRFYMFLNNSDGLKSNAICHVPKIWREAET